MSDETLEYEKRDTEEDGKGGRADWKGSGNNGRLLGRASEGQHTSGNLKDLGLHVLA